MMTDQQLPIAPHGTTTQRTSDAGRTGGSQDPLGAGTGDRPRRAGRVSGARPAPRVYLGHEPDECDGREAVAEADGARPGIRVRSPPAAREYARPDGRGPVAAGI